MLDPLFLANNQINLMTGLNQQQQQQLLSQSGLNYMQPQTMFYQQQMPGMPQQQ